MSQSMQPHEGDQSLGYLLNHAKGMSSDNLRDEIVENIYTTSKSICKDVVKYKDKNVIHSEKLDKVLTSPIWGFPIMLAILGAVFYLTIAGANVPSSMLAQAFGWMEGQLTLLFNAMHAPDWLHGVLVLGFFRGTGWVISVMLPPMAIFFPAFALLENYGYFRVLLLTWTDCLKKLADTENSR